MDLNSFDWAKVRLSQALQVTPMDQKYFKIEVVEEQKRFKIHILHTRDVPSLYLSWETQGSEIDRIIDFCEQTKLFHDWILKDLLIELHIFLQRVRKVGALAGTDWTGITRAGVLQDHTEQKTWIQILGQISDLYSSYYFGRENPGWFSWFRDGSNLAYSFSPDLMEFDPVDLDKRIRENEKRALKEVPELLGKSGGNVVQEPIPTIKSKKHHRTESKAKAVDLIIKILKEWKPKTPGKKISFSGVFIPEIADRYAEQRGNRQTVSEPTLRGYFYETAGNVPELIDWRIQHKHYFDRE
ncbi:MAG: hypothetical protein HUU10_14360 [Bacteroidetes bacterium]|nr:hypothetical protein [Bacteroidota bacterium]